MYKTTFVQARIDEETKKQAQHILSDLHISLSEAIGMYFRQIIFTRGIPFDLRVPNERTLKTMAEVDAGENLHEAANAEELLKELNG